VGGGGGGAGEGGAAVGFGGVAVGDLGLLGAEGVGVLTEQKLVWRLCSAGLRGEIYRSGSCCSMSARWSAECRGSPSPLLRRLEAGLP